MIRKVVPNWGRFKFQEKSFKIFSRATLFGRGESFGFYMKGGCSVTLIWVRQSQYLSHSSKGELGSELGTCSLLFELVPNLELC